MPIFRKSEMRTECDACGYRFDLTHGGVCARCKRILCYTHLYGSWISRIAADLLSRETTCVDCRSGRPVAPPDPHRFGRSPRREGS